LQKLALQTKEERAAWKTEEPKKPKKTSIAMNEKCLQLGMIYLGKRSAYN